MKNIDKKTLRSQRNASKTLECKKTSCVLRLAKLVLRKLLQYQKQLMSAAYETSTLSKLERILKFSQKQKNYQIDKANLLRKKYAVGITIPNLKQNKTSKNRLRLARKRYGALEQNGIFTISCDNHSQLILMRLSIRCVTEKTASSTNAARKIGFLHVRERCQICVSHSAPMASKIFLRTET